MSKADVKKYIKSLDKSSLEELVMDLYSARKEAKDYLEYVIKPNDKGKSSFITVNPQVGDSLIRCGISTLIILIGMNNTHCCTSVDSFQNLRFKG